MQIFQTGTVPLPGCKCDEVMKGLIQFLTLEGFLCCEMEVNILSLCLRVALRV